MTFETKFPFRAVFACRMVEMLTYDVFMEIPVETRNEWFDSFVDGELIIVTKEVMPDGFKYHIETREKIK